MQFATTAGTTAAIAGMERIDLAALGLKPGTPYWLHVFSNDVTTIYQVKFAVPDQASSSTQGTPFSLVDSSGIPPGETTGLSLDSSQATEWFSVPLNHAGTAADSISITALDSAGQLTLAVYSAAGALIQSATTGEDPTATVNLQGVSQQTLLIEISGGGPAEYEIWTVLGQSNPSILDLSGDTSSIDFSSAQLPAYERRDVLLGGDGNDTISGGPGTDWIFGGDGNDVLSAGAGPHQGDLIWGGAGDDIFQIIPTALPATLATQDALNPLAVDQYVPTYSDEFDGGPGNNEVLYLGGDTDNQGRPVPDNVAVRYNSLLGRYEFTARVWDDTNQRWAIDPQTGTYLQYYDFFQSVNAQTFVINTQGGDDVVHADPGYTIDAGYADPSTEWGITEGDIRQGATLGLVINGGAGDDRLYGSAGNDTIEGGDGDDVIVGGGGNDLIDGGAGNDWITGGSDTPPDAYEFTGPQATGSNDTPGNASPLDVDLSGLLADQNVTFPVDTSLDPSLSQGDAGDWYSLPTPVADNAFGTLDQALLTSQLVRLSFLDPGAQDLVENYLDNSPVQRPWLYVYPAQDVTVNGITTYEPVDQYNGVPDHYLIHVVNPNDYAVIASTNVTQAPASTDATFTLSVNGVTVKFTVKASGFTALAKSLNFSLPNLASLLQAPLNAALVAAGLSAGTVTVGAYTSAGQIPGLTSTRLGFWLMSGNSLQVTASAGDTVMDLGFGSMSAATSFSPTPAPLGSYQLTFLASNGLGNTTDISVGSADVTLTPTGAASSAFGLAPPVPVDIPLGDLTGDGYPDFISSEQDAPYQGYGLATVSFGGAGATAGSLSRYALTLQLPAPLFQSSFVDGQSSIIAGDFNGDGLADIAVAVSPPAPIQGITSTPQAPVVYIVLGRPDAFGIIGNQALPAQIAPPSSAWSFSLNLDGRTSSDGQLEWDQVTINPSDESGASTPAALVALLNAKLQATPALAGRVVADLIGGRLRLLLLSGQSIQISIPAPETNPALTLLGFTNGQSNAWSSPINVAAVADVVINLPAADVGQTIDVADAGDITGALNPATGKPVEDILVGNPKDDSGNGAVYLDPGDAALEPGDKPGHHRLTQR